MASSPAQLPPISSSVSSNHSAKIRLLLLNLLLIVATGILYAPVNHHPFLNYDDPWYVSENLHISSGLNAATLRWAFLSRGYCHNWHPVTWISHALDIQIFGLNSGAHHDVNVVLHIVNVLLLFWVLRAATGYLGRSFAVAAVFALHPINVESVAWLSERKTLLSTAFFLLALAAYRWYADKPTDGRYWTVAGFYLLGLMSKPQVIALPLLLLLWDYWPLQRMFPDQPSSKSRAQKFSGRPFGALVAEKVPLFVIAAGSALMTMSAQEVGTPQHWPYTLSVRLQNAIVSYAWYVEKAFWPAHLAGFYPHPGNSLTGLHVGLALIFLLAVTVLSWMARRQRYLLVGWLWFLIALVPMIGLVQVWEQARADRYAYVSLLGIFIMVCWGVAEWADRRRIPVAVLRFAGTVIVVALAVVAHVQIGYWRDSPTLWSRSLAVTPANNFVAEESLGYVLLRDHRTDEAAPHLFNALELRPNDAFAHLQAGICEYRRGNREEAILHFEKAANTADADVEVKRAALLGMSTVYRDLGDIGAANDSVQKAGQLPKSLVQPAVSQ